MPSIVNQVAFLKKEINTARKDFLRIRNTLESCIQINIEEFTNKSREGLKNFEDINEKCVRVQKNVEHLSDSLCALEIKEALEWKICAQSHDVVKMSLESQKENEEKMMMEIQNMKIEMKNWEKNRKEEDLKEKEEKRVENEVLKNNMLLDQETLMFKFFDFVLTGTKHKKKIAELKHRTKQSRARKNGQNNLEQPAGHLINDGTLKEDLKDDGTFKKNSKNEEKSAKPEILSENDSNNSIHTFKKSQSSCLFQNLPKPLSRPFHKSSFSLETHSKTRLKTPKSLRKTSKARVSKNFFKKSSKVSKSFHSLSRSLRSVSKSLHSVKFIRSRNSQKSSETLNFTQSKLTTTPKIKTSNLRASRGSRFSRHRFPSIRLETETVELTSSESETNSLNNGRDLFEEIEIHFQSLENQLFLLKNEVQQGLSPKIQDLESLFQSFVNENKEKYENLHQAIDSDLKPWVLKSVSSNMEEALLSIRQVTSLTSKKMEEKYEELEFNLQESIKELNTSILVKRREVSDLALQVKRHEKNIMSNSNDIADVENDLLELTSCYDKLKDSMISVNALLKQDEIDKKSLSLLAVKSNKHVSRKKNLNPVRLDRNCISCANNAPQVLPAFKVACLAYNSSPVQVNDRVASRIEILDDQFEILHSMPRSLTPICKKRSLTPDLPRVVVNQR
jgi:hypothetical protein